MCVDCRDTRIEGCNPAPYKLFRISRSLASRPNMADLNSWEDDPAAQEDNLTRQTQQMNLNSAQQQGPGPAGAFRPNATSFQPGAATFQPGQQFGGYVPQYQQQQYYGQNYYPQYVGGPGNIDQYGQQAYNAPYGQGGYNQGYSMCLNSISLWLEANIC